jgi:solute carrier family 12 (potassium/chloride transporters), member 9
MSGKGRTSPSGLGYGTLTRGRPTFLARTATDDAAQLFRRASFNTASQALGSEISSKDQDLSNTYKPTDNLSPAEPSEHEHTKRIFGKPYDGGNDTSNGSPVRKAREQKSKQNGARSIADDSLTGQMHQHSRSQAKGEKSTFQRTSSALRAVNGSQKLGTFSGVFVPTSLNVLSILMFIRFGFILGQSGILGMMVMLIAAYLINLVTTMSISAVASNGTVRGGGAYYLISRSLGPEFGGSIGIVFYLGFVFNTGMNAVGLINCLNQNFGEISGSWVNVLKEGFWWQYLWATIVLVICTSICLAGSSIFARASNGLLVILLGAIFSIPFSTLFVTPFQADGIEYTGLSVKTFTENLLPRFTKHAAGSQLRGKENFQDLFGIIFPATGGIFAGASMSGDLKNPSKSIPKGTLYGLALTFFSYTLVIFAMAASITRTSFYNNVNVLQDTNVSEILILLGEFATTFFSTLMGVIGPAKLLQAISRDSVLPGLSLFGQGTAKTDEPIYAIFLTHIVAQVTMLFDINRIASFITMTYLMTFFVTNLACFLLKISSAPNFRPSFHYFKWWTAAAGAAASVAAMFFVDGLYATGSIGILVMLFLLIHYTTPPKAWGDVSQSLLYHQVRKYLLRLRHHEHVKFWRPQILLFVNDPRRGYKLIQFCNSLKKGALFILGHVIVTSNFGASVPEARRQQAAWTKYIDFSRIKAFVNIAVSPSIEWGARNIVLSAGLGGMRPNIVVMGFYNLQQFRQEQPLVDVPSPPPERRQDSLGSTPALKKRKRSKVAKQLEGSLPTDICYVEKRTDVQSYVMVLEDMLLKLQINTAIATGFHELELPNQKEGNLKKYIDLWPIQMSAQLASEEGDVLTTNFDTYTLIMQLGCILHTVPSWKRSYELRVAVFVEYESDVAEERLRVAELLENLRIEAEILVFWLASGDVKSYQSIVNGTDTDGETDAQVEKVLEDEEWWKDIKKLRGRAQRSETSAIDDLPLADDVPWPSSSFQHSRDPSTARVTDLKSLIKQFHHRASFSNLSTLGVSLGMHTHRLNDDMISRHASHASASEESDTASDAESEFESSTASLSGEDGTDDDEGTGSDLLSASVAGITGAAPGSGREEPRSAAHSKKSSLSSRKSRSAKKAEQQSDKYLPAAGGNISDFQIQSNDMEEPLVNMHSPEDDGKGRGRPGTRGGDLEDAALSPGQPFPTSVPKASVTDNDGGPSIMFAKDPRPARKRLTDPDDDKSQREGQIRSIYQRNSETKPNSATGFPASGSIPLSFNDLPSRAQHLILNELMAQHSEDTAVIFTTLPAPVEGTYKSESESLAYVSNLEVLCGGLPPTLLVHSNSMTVTMNL